MSIIIFYLNKKILASYVKLSLIEYFEFIDGGELNELKRSRTIIFGLC